MSICQWDSILERVQKVAECILGTASSSAKSPTMRHANERDLPEKVSGVKPLEELTLAKDHQGERIWHEEECLYRTLLSLEWQAD